MQKLENVIRELIISNKIRTQNDLTEMLSEKGYSTTQSNISRILKKLNTAKLVDENNPKCTYYVIQQKPLEINAWVKGLVKTIQSNGLEIVISTREGSASVIAKIIDEKNIADILGTISGIDTALVILKNKECAESVLEKLKEMVLIVSK